MPFTAPQTSHFFTVDVEEHFQVNAFEGVVTRDRWAEHPSRLAVGVDRLLELLAAYDTRGTFFVLGWCARQTPEVIRRIAAAGHEVASHGYWHRRVTALTADEFRQDLRDSRAAIEDVTGEPVLGYRAPSFSIVPGREWALDVLAEEGFVYDSSLFPIRRRGYGYPGAAIVPTVMHRAAGPLVEFPLATTVALGRRLPAAGGGYLRQLPLALIRRAFREHDARRQPATLYIHPWELDPEQPRLPVSAITRVRHYRGLRKSLPALTHLLEEFRFGDIRSALGAYLPGSPAAVAPALAGRA